MSINISFGITVHDEHKRLASLLNLLEKYKKENDEIVILVDEDGHTDEVLQVCKGYGISPHFNSLNSNFGKHKNYLNKKCKKEYIMQLDADELPHELLLENLHDMVEENDVDLIYVPRINIVDGITDEHIKKWGWVQQENGWLNFPDYQSRIFRNNSKIQWDGKVHETIRGFNDFSKFPAYEELSLYHHKKIERQEKQNEMYDKIE